MRKQSLIIAIIVYFTTGFFSAAVAQDCSANTDAVTILNGNNWAQCENATADVLQVSFYKLALCTQKPTYQNDTGCVYLLDASSSVDVEIGVGVDNIPLVNGDVSIPEGTYSHAMLLIGTELGLKTTFEFATPQYDGEGNQGRFCWTNGLPIVWGYQDYQAMMMTCGDEPDPELSIENFKAFSDDSGGVVAQSLNNTTPDTVYDVYLLDDEMELATVSTDNLGFPTGNAKYIWGVQKFNAPPTITAASTNVDMAFKITDGMGMGFNGYACDGSAACVEGVNVNGFQFVVDAD